jgi:hypothetical protein
LFKDADKPLYEWFPKHSKFSAIVGLYNLKCMSRWSNASFTWLLGFINELIPSEVSLSKDTYEVKKYVRDLSLPKHVAMVVCYFGRTREIRNMYSM